MRKSSSKRGGNRRMNGRFRRKMKSRNMCRFVWDPLRSSGPRSLWNGTPGQEARILKYTDSVTFYDTLPVPKNPTTRVNFYSPRLEVGGSLVGGTQRALHPLGSCYGRKRHPAAARSPPEIPARGLLVRTLGAPTLRAL